MRSLLIAIAALMLIFGTQGKADTAVVEIDFEDLTVGAVVTDQYTPLGVTFSLLGPSPNPGPKVVDIDDSRYPPATGFAITPSVEQVDPFFDIELDFSTPIDYFSILSLDSDEPLTIRSFLGSTPVDTVSFPAGGDEAVILATLGSIGGIDRFDRVVIDVVAGSAGGLSGGPEIFDDMKFNPVPVPSTVFLLAGGLAALVGSRRKYRK